MHGQVKTEKSDAVKEKEKKQKDGKLKIYREGMSRVFADRKANVRDWEAIRHIDEVLFVNPDVYTLWNIRKEILLDMIQNKLIDEPAKTGESELKITEFCLKKNPKSYGAWHHRCWILDQFPQIDLKFELTLCNKYLKLDSRNFHCWSYRRFVSSKLGISPEEDLSYTLHKIEEDFSNYSSWHYRSKLLPLIHSDPYGFRPIKEETHLEELDLVQNAAFTDPNDSSAWFYLRWLLGRQEPKLEVVSIFLSKELGKIFVVFSKPISPSNKSVLINFGGSNSWRTFDSSNESCLWFTDIPATTSKQYSLEIILNDQTEQVILTENDHFSSRKNPKFDPEVSPKLKAVLEGQLTSCNQLLELEPESKWPLLTSVVFMKAIDTTIYKEEIIKRLNQLMNCDPYRQCYYSDLMSKFLIEESLKSGITSMNSVSLANLSLKVLCHTQYLAHVENIDLSHNDLQRSLSKLSYFANCRKLILDGNCLVSLSNFPSLPYLTSLSLVDNKIEDTQQIVSCVEKLPSIEKLILKNNPLITDKQYPSALEKINALRPTLQVIA